MRFAGYLLFCLGLMLTAPTSAQMPDVELGDCEQTHLTADDFVQKALRSIRSNDLRMAGIYARRALDANEKDAHALYLLGEVGFRQGNLHVAEANWVKCLEVCPDYKAELSFFLGIIFLENGYQTKGESYLERYLADPMRNGLYDADAREVLESSRIIEYLKTNPVDYQPKPVRQISTTADEYLAIISPDESLAFFTRRQMKRPLRGGPGDRARMVEEFSIAHKSGSGYESGIALEEPFNQNFNEGGPSITANNRELYFTVCQQSQTGPPNCDIYYSIRDGKYWGSIRSVGEHVNSVASWESQPSVSANGDKLYFTSDRAGGYGGLDIYVIRRLPDGSWSEPENMGPTINTDKDEKSPFIHSDSHTLYFASSGHPGMGALDIFYARQNEMGEFEKPINIGYPINTEEDEIGLFVSLDGSKAYFSSNKLNGPGGWDLYEFRLHAAAKPEEVALVRGTLLDENNEVVGDAQLTLKNLKSKEITRIAVDIFTGEYAAVVPLQQDMILKIEKDGVAFSSQFVGEDTHVEGGIIESDIEVAEIRVGGEYRLNDINFATNSYALNNSAKLIIEEFALYLEDNPSVKVDIQGHTDDVGDDSDNLVLSKKRAEVVYKTLIDLGIPASRMTHHGYGEGRPVVQNTSDGNRAKNRRTVFVITAR